MDRRDAFEKSWAARHRVSIDEIRAHRFETEDGYDLPSLAAHYRTWCAAIESVVVEFPGGYDPYRDLSEWHSGFNDALDACREGAVAAGIKVAL